MTSDMKLLPLPPRLAEYGEATRSLWQDYARACIEADRKARTDGEEAVAWRRRHPSEDDPSGWHGWIVSDKKPRQEIAGSEYQPLYTHPAPDDVARLVDALDTIGTLSTALRVGGPDPMDLEGLSAALNEAVNIAYAATAPYKQEVPHD